jgi:hypothetical protein
MSYSPQPPSSPERKKQELRVQSFRERLQLPLPDSFSDYSQKDLDATEGFFRYLLALEGRPTSSLAKQLIRNGVELPPPDRLDDLSLSAKLNEIIEGLAKLRNYLVHTDHLSDRELYEQLWNDTLNEPDHELDESMGDYQTTIDLVGDFSPISLQLYHRYYADEIDRGWWLRENPGYDMPEMEPAPYDRDRFLPQNPLHD